ncbi:hypothetical protein PROFUN_01819 [Planoprotostelium fungivorum]|uniref:TFIIS-type domain-containing protein n=1 Tax=Planoprotostelium fungivorum TaxID=1890364 RepID=A0A2P6NYT2_9EUKA|nr:hypothetical protein PROFUN_01819 [Planoprotostelium fungivorum]
MLYPREDRIKRKLLYLCRICGHTENASDLRIYRNEVLHSSEEKTVWISDLAMDPTLPRTSATCSKCKGKEAVYFQTTSNKPDESMSLYFVCCNPQCAHRWKE